MSKRRTVAAAGATLLAAGGIGLVAGLPASTADPSVAQLGKATAAERSIGRGQAARIAVRTIERRTGKRARVTDIGREDDYGARWEVEVTLRNGREFDVYVNGRGKVVKVKAKGFDD